MNPHPESIDAWKKKVEWFTSTPQNRESDRFDGEPMEVGWNISPRFTTSQILAEIQKMMYEMQFTGRIILMSMYNDIERKTKQRVTYCELHNCGKICKKIPARTLVVSRAWIRKKWYGSNTYKPNGEWDAVAEHMLLNFSESGHPVFRGTSASK